MLLDETPGVTDKRGELARDGVVFAARLDPAAVELRLGAEIAEAAVNTPHARQSARGDAWVTLAPDDWDDASDRLEAWYFVAWRLAGKKR